MHYTHIQISFTVSEDIYVTNIPCLISLQSKVCLSLVLTRNKNTYLPTKIVARRYQNTIEIQEKNTFCISRKVREMWMIYYASDHIFRVSREFHWAEQQLCKHFCSIVKLRLMSRDVHPLSSRIYRNIGLQRNFSAK